MCTRIRGAGRLALGMALVTSFACKDRKTDAAGTESAVVTPSDSVPSTALAGDHRSVAEKVVARSAGVKEGDLVLVYGSDEDLPLLEDIAVEVRKRGGDPLVTVETNSLNRRTYDEVPAKYDSRTPEINLKLAGIVDVIIGTEAGESRTMKGVPPERIAARAKASAPVGELSRKRGIRTVILGNGLYPSIESAERFKVSRDELAGMMYGGVDADYAEIQATGDRVQKALAGGKELRITNANGTDLRVGIAGRQITVSDGIISAEDLKRGGTAVSVWLPAGEVFLTPVPGTAVGTVVSDQGFFQGQPIEGLRLEVKGGKLVSMTAKSGLDPLKALYDAAGAGKDLLGVIDIGINSAVKVPKDSPIHVWSQAGMVTVTVGNNTWAGGSNAVNFGVPAYALGSTVTVDGKVIVQDGKLVPAETMANR